MTEQRLEFKTAINQLLDLIINSLYSHKEIFLRELLSNASDAIDRARYESLTNTALLEDEPEWSIRISADRSAGTLTVSDNGIGMTRDEAIEALGTIAQSGTREFIAAMKSRELKDHPELIGRFGVGFYASFMVADRVTVRSRKAGLPPGQGVRWESSADGSFTVGDIEKTRRGTDVVLHLREDERAFLEEWEIRTLVRKYSDFIEHPILMEVERRRESALDKGGTVTVREDERLNSGRALWLRDRSEVSQEEYFEFYKHISHDFLDPATVIHTRAEGTSEFVALLFIPSKVPLPVLQRDFKIGPALYVNRVRIMDHCEELIPPYLRFVSGVVDSSDLPLNVSREMLQSNRQAEVIRKHLTKKVLDTLTEMKAGENDKYLSFYAEFGRVLKEGIHFDPSRRETVADLLLFHSTQQEAGGLTTLSRYVETMKDGQEEIYYLPAPSIEDALSSPYHEAFTEKGYEVLIMVDEVDEFVIADLAEYRGKRFRSLIRGDVHPGADREGEPKEARAAAEGLLGFIGEGLKDVVKEVRLSRRLRESACCLVGEEGDLAPHTERLLKAMGQQVPAHKRILEINPSHQLFKVMHALFDKDPGSPLLAEYTGLLYDQALLLEGSKPRDPAAFAKAVAKLMVESAGTA